MTVDEVLKTGLVFVHFVVSALALAAILRADVHILARYNQPLSSDDCDKIHGTKRVVTPALWLLWLTGLAICALGWMGNPAYLMNQKLWMKVIVVLMLTVNGVFLHRVAFSYVRQGVRLSDAAPRAAALMTLMGTLSSSGWVFASFLGIARALNNKQNFLDVLGLYLLVLGGGLVVASIVMRRLRAQSAGRTTGVLYALSGGAAHKLAQRDAA